MDLYNYIELLLVPITSIITWFAARKTRNNNMLHQLQQTIDMLVEKNKQLYQTITEQNDKIIELSQQLSEVRRENAELIKGQTRISQENAELKKQIQKIKTTKK